MSIAPEVRKFLEDNEIEYEVIERPQAFTAQEEAALSHTSGYEWAKTVIMFTRDGEPLMAVLPASFMVDTYQLANVVGGEGVEVAEEEEFGALYPNCELGAMPPLGCLYHQRVFVDERLAEDEYITFNAGDHELAIRMRYRDYERLVNPVVDAFGFQAAGH